VCSIALVVYSKSPLSSGLDFGIVSVLRRLGKRGSRACGKFYGENVRMRGPFSMALHGNKIGGVRVGAVSRAKVWEKS